MPDDLSSCAPMPDTDTPPAHVRLVLTLVLNGPAGSGECHWHVRDVESGAQLLSARWPFDRERFSHDFTASRALKAIGDAWACCGPF